MIMKKEDIYASPKKPVKYKPKSKAPKDFNEDQFHPFIDYKFVDRENSALELLEVFYMNYPHNVGKNKTIAVFAQCEGGILFVLLQLNLIFFDINKIAFDF